MSKYPLRSLRFCGGFFTAEAQRAQRKKPLRPLRLCGIILTAEPQRAQKKNFASFATLR